MTVQTHLIATTTSYVVFAYLYRKGINIPVIGSEPLTIYPLLGIPTAVVGSMLPDVDIENSRVSKKFPFVSPFLKHRGITHTLVFVATCYLSMAVNYSLNTKLIISAIFGLIFGILTIKGRFALLKTLAVAGIFAALSYSGEEVLPSLLFGMGFGWLFHIVEDMFNKKGCPILWPLTNKKLHLPLGPFLVKTRTWQEAVFLIIWEGVNAAILLIYMNVLRF